MPREDRLIDKTFLSLDLAEERGLVHRDYIAHCHRWSHVVRHMGRSSNFADAVLLDVGCGKEFPLAKTLYVNKMSPKLYVGVDANKLEIPEILRGGSKPAKLVGFENAGDTTTLRIPTIAWSESDVCALDPDDVSLEIVHHDGKKGYQRPNVVVCFEVLEHVTPSHARRMLKKFLDLTVEDATYFISTPCFNGSAAGNHINEMTYEAMGTLVEDVGYKIDGVWGTFASIADYKEELFGWRWNGQTHDLNPVFDALRSYYDTNLLAIMFAPLFPDKSRNCIWRLSRADENAPRLFSGFDSLAGPWSQHPLWRDLKGERTQDEPTSVEEAEIEAQEATSEQAD